MKRKLIFGSILAVFILVMSPSIPAVNYNTAKQINEKSLDEIQEELYQLAEQYQDENGIGGIIFLLLKWLGFFLSVFSVFNILPYIYSFFMYFYLLIVWGK